jgi:hypothetical protein
MFFILLLASYLIYSFVFMPAVERWRIKRWYAGRTEPVFIIATDPETGEEPALKYHRQFCVFAPAHLVIRTARLHENYMALSGNEFYRSIEAGYGKPLEHDFSLKVIAIPFQEGVYCTENYNPLYIERVILTIDAERQKIHGHHHSVCQKNEKTKGQNFVEGNWYYVNMNKQRI